MIASVLSIATYFADDILNCKLNSVRCRWHHLTIKFSIIHWFINDTIPTLTYYVNYANWPVAAGNCHSKQNNKCSSVGWNNHRSCAYDRCTSLPTGRHTQIMQSLPDTSTLKCLPADFCARPANRPSYRHACLETRPRSVERIHLPVYEQRSIKACVLLVSKHSQNKPSLSFDMYTGLQIHSLQRSTPRHFTRGSQWSRARNAGCHTWSLSAAGCMNVVSEARCTVLRSVKCVRLLGAYN